MAPIDERAHPVVLRRSLKARELASAGGGAFAIPGCASRGACLEECLGRRVARRRKALQCVSASSKRAAGILAGAECAGEFWLRRRTDRDFSERALCTSMPMHCENFGPAADKKKRKAGE